MYERTKELYSLQQIMPREQYREFVCNFGNTVMGQNGV